jgi:inositol oxygenase
MTELQNTQNTQNTQDIKSYNLRTYKANTEQHKVYMDMHKYQTYDYAKSQKRKYANLDNGTYTVEEVLNMMDEFIDPSDPDMDLPNSIHAYQTAERIHNLYNKTDDDEQFQVCGLIHDLGKILYKFGEPTWSVVGDTFPTGCEYSKTIIYYDDLQDNPDYNNPKYNTKYGVYKEKVGIQNLTMSYGHDEYLYQVLKSDKNRDKHFFASKYVDIIRFHSFYPWHTGNDYKYLMKESDNYVLESVRHFNQFDLYSKKDNTKITKRTKEYYSRLLKKYFPQKLSW